MPECLHADEHRTWRSVQRMHAKLAVVLAQGLRADADLSLPDLDVLAALSEAPGSALRARDLRCELQWEKSRLAHHIGRMERRGYVRRDVCAEDARAPLVIATDRGLDALRAAAPAHVERIRDLVFGALTPAQALALREAAEAVLARLEEHAPEKAAADPHG